MLTSNMQNVRPALYGLRNRSSYVFLLLASFLIYSQPAQAADPISINTVTDLTNIGLIPEMPLDGNYKLVFQNFGSDSYSEYESLDLGPVPNPAPDDQTRYVAAYIGGPVYVNGTFTGTINVFTGNFDGNGKTLTGLNRPLFWSVEGSAGSRSTIENLTLQTQGTVIHPTEPTLNEDGLQSTYGEQPQFPRGVLANDIKYADINNVDVSGEINAIVTGPGGASVLLEKVGGLVGSAERVNFNDVTANVDITVKSSTRVNGFDFNNAASKIGGLIGDAQYVNIQDSSSQGDIRGTRSVGGLIGSLGNSTLTNVSASGNVVAQSEVRDFYPDLAVGGLIGSANWSQITNSTALGDVYGNEGIGGFIGMSANNTISNSRASGRVVVGETLVGGFIGISSNDSINGSSSSGSVFGRFDSGGLIGRLTLSQIRNSYIVREMATGLFGKTTESDVENTYSFTLGNPELWSAFLKLADQIVSEKIIDKLITSDSDGALISTTVGQPIKVFIDLATQLKLRVWLQTPSGDKIILGDLEVIEGKVTLPPMEFSKVGTYEIELTEVTSVEILDGDSVLTINVEVSE